MIARRAFLGAGVATLAACATNASPAASIEPVAFDVWPSPPPGGEKVTAKESVIERATEPGQHDRAAINITRPRLRVFRPARPDGAAVLIMPGGGYQRVVLDKEGDETALRLAQAGVTAAVLIYRLPGDGWAAGYDAPLQDAQRALRLLRSGRLAPGLDPARIGVLGFSAGGHLAASLALRSSVKTYEPIDAADAASPRPDFAALMYAAYLDGAMPAAAGAASPPMPSFIAMAKGAQPMFLVHAQDDASVPVANTLRMAEALKAAGVPTETHVFERGGHGFGIARARGLPAEHWPDLFLSWGRARGFFR